MSTRLNIKEVRKWEIITVWFVDENVTTKQSFIYSLTPEETGFDPALLFSAFRGPVPSSLIVYLWCSIFLPFVYIPLDGASSLRSESSPAGMPIHLSFRGRRRGESASHPISITFHLMFYEPFGPAIRPVSLSSRRDGRRMMLLRRNGH